MEEGGAMDWEPVRKRAQSGKEKRGFGGGKG